MNTYTHTVHTKNDAKICLIFYKKYISKRAVSDKNSKYYIFVIDRTICCICSVFTL